METLAVNPTKIATKWAFIYLLVSIVITYAFEFLSIDQNSPAKYISYIPFIAFCFLAQKELRDQSGGYMSFGQGFSVGFRFGLFSGLLLAVFVFIYLKFLSPDMLVKSIEQQQVALSEQGMSQDQIDKAMDMGTKYGAIFGAVATAIGSLILGCIIALIGAAIFKKERTAYDIIESAQDPTI
ncbi:DUF4199 domain-containing protein [Mucilaginibacter sp.]|uniref:DUF4199 domain-containing protein n=1 Tax=Mucilaginibacter sp. TaxID=1882438 RepID=UPI0035BC7052